METYILIKENNNGTREILSVWTDREACRKMCAVYRKMYGDTILCQTVQVHNTVPAWAERVLELD